MKTRYQLNGLILSTSFWINRAKEDGDEKKEIQLKKELNQLKLQLQNKDYDRDGTIKLTLCELKNYLSCVLEIVDWTPSKTDLTEEECVELLAIKAKLEDRLEKGDYEPEINERGNTIIRDHHDGDRYVYDDKLKASDGWEQYDTEQDAWYFGIWINPKKREFFTYAEGDTTHVICKDAASYNSELKALMEVHPQGAYAWALDDEGCVTSYKSEAPKPLAV
jgi:hypothetical protein